MSVWTSSSSQTNSSGVPYVATLNVLDGALAAESRTYNTSTANISGGTLTTTRTNNASTTNISGGSLISAFTFNTGTTNISNGNVAYIQSFDSSTANISGGSANFSYGYDSSTTTISGGTFAKGFLLMNTAAKTTFIGTNLTFAYQSYGNSNPYGIYADFFKISGTFGGAAKTYDLYIRNDDNNNGPAPANTAQRQFAFAAPVVVPEAGTLALLLPALSVFGAVVAARRRE